VTRRLSYRQTIIACAFNAALSTEARVDAIQKTLVILGVCDLITALSSGTYAWNPRSELGRRIKGRFNYYLPSCNRCEKLVH
jgi:hypothetical protein